MEGRDVKAWREARGLSINGLAERLGVSASTVLRWERGTQPDSPVMLGLALAELDRLLKREQARQSPPRRGRP